MWLALSKLRSTDHQWGKVFADDSSGIIKKFQESPKINEICTTGVVRKPDKKIRQKGIDLFDPDQIEFDVVSFKKIMKSAKDLSDADKRKWRYFSGLTIIKQIVLVRFRQSAMRQAYRLMDPFLIK